VERDGVRGAGYWQFAYRQTWILGRPEHKLRFVHTRRCNPVAIGTDGHPNDDWLDLPAHYDRVDQRVRNVPKPRSRLIPHRDEMARHWTGTENDLSHWQILAAQQHGPQCRLSQIPQAGSRVG